MCCLLGLWGTGPALATVEGCSNTLRPTLVKDWEYTNVWAGDRDKFVRGAVIATGTIRQLVPFRVTALPEVFHAIVGFGIDAAIVPDLGANVHDDSDFVGFRVRHLRTETLSAPLDTEAVDENGGGAYAGRNRSLASTWPFPSESKYLGSYSVGVDYEVELVLLDPAKYTAGALPSTTNVAWYGVRFGSQIQAGIAPCVNFTPYSRVGLSTPVMPAKPPKPTCSFAPETLNQAVELPPVRISEVPAHGSTENDQPNTKADFEVVARDCEDGSVFRIYLTDSNNSANNTQTLSLKSTSANHGKLGLRLFSGSNAPRRLGPAPAATGGGLNFIQYGPVRGNVAVPMRAQYVRLAGVAPWDLQTGPVAADLTLTVFYP